MPLEVVDGDRPRPDSDEDRKRWVVSSRRHRLITGAWTIDAHKRQQEFFNVTAQATLPKPDLSCNPFLAYLQQVTTLYEDQPQIRFAGRPSKRDIGRIITPQLWPMQADNLLTVMALREGFLRLDWLPGAETVTYQVVPAHEVVAMSSDEKPWEPNFLSWLRPRRRGDRKIWTWETWDVRSTTSPVFRIEEVLDGDGNRTDVTGEFFRSPDGRPLDEFPYTDADGPIFPWATYHAKVSNRLWNPTFGEELVEGALNCSALLTWWMGGFRDASYPVRGLIDGIIDSAQISQTDGRPVKILEMAPGIVVPIRSTSDRGATMQEWTPAIDPKQAGEAISDYVGRLGIFAGLSAQDVTTSQGLSRVSGAVLTVSRSGLRRARKKTIPPMTMGDQPMLATAARLANRYGGARLPTEAAAYTPVYAEIPATPEEIRTAIEVAEKHVELGSGTVADVIMVRDKSLTREEAEEQAVKNAEFTARLARIRGGQNAEPASTGGDDPEPASTGDDPDDPNARRAAA